MKTSKKIKELLEYLRQEIQAERISTSEIIELQSLVKHIEPDDVLLLEWAGVPETKPFVRIGGHAGPGFPREEGGRFQ